MEQLNPNISAKSQNANPQAIDGCDGIHPYPLTQVWNCRGSDKTRKIATVERVH